MGYIPEAGFTSGRRARENKFPTIYPVQYMQHSQEARQLKRKKEQYEVQACSILIREVYPGSLHATPGSALAFADDTYELPWDIFTMETVSRFVEFCEGLLS